MDSFLQFLKAFFMNKKAYVAIAAFLLAVYSTIQSMGTSGMDAGTAAIWGTVATVCYVIGTALSSTVTTSADNKVASFKKAKAAKAKKADKAA